MLLCFMLYNLVTSVSVNVVSSLTCEVENLRPLFADVDTNVRSSHSQVGTTLIEYKGLDLQQKQRINVNSVRMCVCVCVKLMYLSWLKYSFIISSVIVLF